MIFFLPCFDTVGWATGRASGLKKTGCWFVGGDDFITFIARQDFSQTPGFY